MAMKISDVFMCLTINGKIRASLDAAALLPGGHGVPVPRYRSASLGATAGDRVGLPHCETVTLGNSQ
jgi:hypothetical protein